MMAMVAAGAFVFVVFVVMVGGVVDNDVVVVKVVVAFSGLRGPPGTFGDLWGSGSRAGAKLTSGDSPSIFYPSRPVVLQRGG